jgi:hypothetical protein
VYTTFEPVRYQNFSIRSQLLAEAANFGGWVLHNIAPAERTPFWLLNHPDAAGGEPRIAWSMMHGNEPTGFEALLHLIRCGQPQCDWTLVPLVNPSGVDAFTRFTSEGIDLNRRARDQGPLESDLLKSVLASRSFKLALNLHDQRSLFCPNGQAIPSSLSVLAPRFINQGHESFSEPAQAWAGTISSLMHELEPNWGYARFDDAYYPTAFGEWTQELGVPTVTVETGVALEDYSRERVSLRLGEVLRTIDAARSPQLEGIAHYQNLPLNASWGVDLELRSGNQSSHWQVWEEVQGQSYSSGIAKAIPQGSGAPVPYQTFNLLKAEFDAIQAKDSWTSLELYAVSSTGLRSFAEALPK